VSFVVRAPFGAHVLPLSEVPDPVFASGVVGDGRALLPEADVTCVTVHSPINGVVTKLKSHAAIITSTRGPSILIHLGIDTVGLRGRGFAPLVEEGDIVDAGTPLIHWDLGPARGAGGPPPPAGRRPPPPGEPVSPEFDEALHTVGVLDPLFSLPDGD